MPVDLSKYFHAAAGGSRDELAGADLPGFTAVITKAPVPTLLGSSPIDGVPVVTVISGAELTPAPVAPSSTAIMVVAATPTSNSASTAAPTETGGIAGIDVSSGMIGLVNAARERFGRQPYDIDANLIKSCVSHAADMAEHTFMDHKGSNGSTPASRATKAGYSWGFIAENVAQGQKTIAAVMDAWMHSQGHRDNILSGTAVDFAAAYAQSDAGTLYWVQCFGKPL
ncbi:hypothetical protein AMAG_00706 [Allomyces macrogynus ATCC 38327]|uniref:SCP domain-containing protein n=1 Tax=Allomyces macrogynus (strain ATCC 38327) TaxID=578462 RepID=A0A0L0RWH6_ALLM3|nr:hypothetical protein AMAG_00706 [Allomyces macrogynus ATCC 38327]|eukprot:KNE54747.1 hypothetical protein AMAG_00706 [Allomyces macrogynus ATCC 38327]